jgi:hypothetical protein
MTNWRGVTLDARSAAMMDEVVKLCPGISVQPSQGSWSGAAASAGTHTGAGAIDIEAASLTQPERDAIVLAMRQVGWAAWHRTPQQGGWGHHIHGVAMGEPQLAPAAKDQCLDYVDGRNGLANNAPDDGPRDFDHVGITWEQYQALGKDDEEDEEMKVIWFLPTGVGGVMNGDTFCGIGYGEAEALRAAGFRDVQLAEESVGAWRAAGVRGI